MDADRLVRPSLGRRGGRRRKEILSPVWAVLLGLFNEYGIAAVMLRRQIQTT